MATAPSLSTSFSAPEALVLELLAWVARRPRSYRETIEAWRTSCPRLPVWEDATDHRLIAVVPGAAEAPGLAVQLTAEGRAMLDREAR
jgi:hypothetical protein